MIPPVKKPRFIILTYLGILDNMGYLPSISVIVIFNLFSLNAIADEMVDALSKGNKFDTDTVKELKNKYEAPKLIREMNELSKKNTYRVPFKKTTPLTNAEWDQMVRNEKNAPNDEFDKPEGNDSDKKGPIVKIPSAPNGYKRAAKEPDAPSAAIKVTNDETAEMMVFPGEDEEPAAAKPLTPPSKKRK